MKTMEAGVKADASRERFPLPEAWARVIRRRHGREEGHG